MRLYWHPFSLIPWRVRIALHEKGIAYEEVKVDVYSSPERSSEFLRLNPFGQIPVLEDDGLVIAESLAILEYLEERCPTPALMPVDPGARAIARQWMCWSTDYWPTAWKKWVAPRIPGGTWTNESVSEGRREIAAHLDVLEARLADREWLVDRYSLADVCYAPLVLVLDRVDLAEEVSTRPAVSRWVDRLRQRPAVQATMMPSPT
ncbi:MAG TPA: glutathione S-transferase family protein [Candidatus Binatia bacterium]|nr:glutathione S-transferase family protein [Candidatus Binatia bacterium]